MLEVTDMIVTGPRLATSIDPGVEVREVAGSDRDLVERVAQEHPPFLRYFENSRSGTSLCTVQYLGSAVGGVLLERKPEAAESGRDAAIAALFISRSERGRGLGSAAIVLAARLLLDEGYERVIAQWVWSVPMYERLGFRVWRTRLVDR